MKADFYKNYVNYMSAVFVAAALSFCSCSDDRTVSSGGLPYKSIRVTVDGETVTAERIDDKNLALRFDMAEDFSHARIDVELNEGYSVIFPTDVTAADLDTYPVLNFRAPDNRIVKVWFTISSKAFPITDATKVTASGIGGCVSVSGKTLTITYERSMNRGEIELDFAEGALMEGASIASSTTFDFTESLTRQLKVEMDGKERIYNVRIDYSKVMDKPIVYGFSEVTGNYVDQQLYPFLNVYKATTVNSVPVRGAATSETPWSWDPGAGDLDVYLAFIGNWAANRPTETIEGIEFAFATIDIDKAKAYMVSNDARSVVMDDVASLVALTGMMTKESTMIYYNGKVLSDRNSEGDWRGTVGFYEDGHIEFWNAGIRDGELVRMTQWVDEAGRDGYLASGTPWDVVSAASGHPWLVREGHLLTRLEMYWNDTGWETALGEAWNGTRSRSYIGLTYDNKLGVAAVSEGTGTCQAAWLLYKMGWKDVFYVAGSNYLDDGFTPTLKVGGNVVVGKADQAAQYAIAIDVKQ